MPVATAKKVEALRVDFRSAARVADLLGVSRSQVTRWLRGAGIDPLNAEKVDLLELVWSSLLRLYERDAALAWLFGVNPLRDRRPIDLIRTGRAEELMRAIRAERSDTFA
jgi:transcriptional regulator with XRE-family HTH domain